MSLLIKDRGTETDTRSRETDSRYRLPKITISTVRQEIMKNAIEEVFSDTLTIFCNADGIINVTFSNREMMLEPENTMVSLSWDDCSRPTLSIERPGFSAIMFAKEVCAAYPHSFQSTNVNPYSAHKMDLTANFNASKTTEAHWKHYFFNPIVVEMLKIVYRHSLVYKALVDLNAKQAVRGRVRILNLIHMAPNLQDVSDLILHVHPDGANVQFIQLYFQMKTNERAHKVIITSSEMSIGNGRVTEMINNVNQLLIKLFDHHEEKFAISDVDRNGRWILILPFQRAFDIDIVIQAMLRLTQYSFGWQI
jgi:hypothetical protein